MPQNTEKLLDLLLLFPVPVSPTATKGTQCKASTAPWLWSSSQYPLWKSWLFKEVSPVQQTVLLKFLFSKPAAHHQGQNLGDPALIWKSPPSCSVRAVELAGDGSCAALQSSGRRKKNPGSVDLISADRWAESGVGRKKQEAEGGNTTRAKGRQLKIHICVRLEWGRAHTCQTPRLSHPVHTQHWEQCGVQVQLFIYICVYKQHSIHFNSKDKHNASWQ